MSALASVFKGDFKKKRSKRSLKAEATAEKLTLRFVSRPPGSYHIRKKLTFGLKPFSISKVLPEGRGGFAKAKIVTTTLNAFMASADPEICDRHVPHYRVVRKEVEPVTANPHCLHQPLTDVKEYIDPKEIPVWAH